METAQNISECFWWWSSSLNMTKLIEFADINEICYNRLDLYEN